MGKISKEDKILIKNLRIEKRWDAMEHMSNIFSTSFGINFAKLTRVWLALISLTAKINSLLFLATLYTLDGVTTMPRGLHARLCRAFLVSYYLFCEKLLKSDNANSSFC